MLSTERWRRFETNLILTCSITLVAYLGIRYAYSQFIIILIESILVTLSIVFILSIKKDGLGPLAITVLGCTTLILLVLIPYDVPVNGTLVPIVFKTVQFSETITAVREDVVLFKEYVLSLTLFDFGFGLVLAYKPSLLYVKNRPTDDMPYPLWESKTRSMTRFSQNLVPLKSFLDEKEKFFIFKYKFVLVSIDNKIYLVRPDENVPETTVLLRTRSGQSLLGIWS